MNSRAAAPGVGEGLIWTADLGTARVRQRPRVATAFYELPARVGCAGGRGCEIEEATPPRCFLFKFSASEISASFEAARSFVLSRSRIIRGKSVALGWCAGGRSRPGSIRPFAVANAPFVPPFRNFAPFAPDTGALH